MATAMDPTNPDSFNHRTATLSTGRTYHLVDQLPSDFDPARTRTILCVHGFPDLWYAWRYQIPTWVHAGYRVLAPDMLGYGRTDKPADAASYSPKHLCADLAALLDFAGVERTVVVGHDWGAAVVWRFGMYYPERVLAMVTLSVPYTPPLRRYISPEEAAKRVPNFTYQAYFAKEESTEFIEKNLPVFLSILYSMKTGLGFVRDPVKAIQTVAASPQAALGSMLLTKEEYDYYLKQFSKGGMRGPLSYYRTGRVRFQEERDTNLPTNLPGAFPVLFIWGKDDPTCSPKHVERMQPLVEGIEEGRGQGERQEGRMKVVALEGVSHWVPWQAKEAVAQEVRRFVREVVDGPSVKL